MVANRERSVNEGRISEGRLTFAYPRCFWGEGKLGMLLSRSAGESLPYT